MVEQFEDERDRKKEKNLVKLYGLKSMCEAILQAEEDLKVINMNSQKTITDGKAFKSEEQSGPIFSNSEKLKLTHMINTFEKVLKKLDE